MSSNLLFAISNKEGGIRLIDYHVHLSGNFTIQSGGGINGSGADCASGTCNAGSNVTIIAEILNVSEGTIKVRIFRAINNLKKICAKMEN